MSEYQISTLIQDRHVTVECDEATARILLPLWAKAEPLTICQHLPTNQIVICFIDDLEAARADEANRNYAAGYAYACGYHD